jgi:hypothetical protein
LRIEARRFLERADRASMIETMKQRQALVEITLRLCVLCCDLARVRAEPVIKWLARIAACTKDKRENGARKYMTGGVHNERMTVIGSTIAAKCWSRTLKG